MFQGRVQGVGSQRARADGDVTFEKELSLTDIVYGPNTGIGGYRAQVCHSKSPPGTCKPVDWNPLGEAPRDEAPKEKLAAKSSGLSIPLLLGAAYLLLS
jgi:hypothetical protein